MAKFYSNLQLFFFCSLKPKEEVQELVIPLIGVNRWRSQNIYVESNNLEDSDAKNKQIVIPSSGDHITDEAIKELIQGVLA